jgi:hypothetical protein
MKKEVPMPDTEQVTGRPLMQDTGHVGGWQPIETCPLQPFLKEKWFYDVARVLVVYNRKHVGIASYGYTERGKGRWKTESTQHVITPTHWMPLPDPPKEPKNEE